MAAVWVWRAGLWLVLLSLGGCATGILTGAERPPASHYPAVSDAQVSDEITRRLLADSSLDASAVTVETRNGVVTLTGTVPDEASSRRAAEIALEVPGVKQLRNQLVLGKRLKQGHGAQALGQARFVPLPHG